MAEPWLLSMDPAAVARHRAADYGAMASGALGFQQSLEALAQAQQAIATVRRSGGLRLGMGRTLVPARDPDPRGGRHSLLTGGVDG